MLRRQSPDFDSLSFLDGSGEMARRIREFDWQNHPLGAPDTWPLPLRAAVGITLNSSFPTCIYWGTDLRLLYNDAWAYIPGPRHPACLGEPAAEVWSDIWEIVEPQFEQVIRTGEGIFVEDQFLPMRRFDVEEETYWTYTFSAIRLEDGSIRGVFNSGMETTANVLQQRNTRFLLELADEFRSFRTIETVRSRPLELLGKHLGADRVGLRDATTRNNPITSLWSADDVPDIPTGEVPQKTWDALHERSILKLDGTDESVAGIERESLDAVGSASAFAVSLMLDNNKPAILFIHSLRPRHWTDLELQTAEGVLERMMGWIERAETTERERIMAREIDHRARNLLSIVQSIVRLAKADDAEQLRKALLGRLSAIAKTHSLLSGRHWVPLPLKSLIQQELAPHLDQDGVQISFSGPSVILSPDETQAMGMVLHELTTNAAKYGALSRKEGNLDVSWSTTAEGQVRLDWSETFPASGEIVENSQGEEGGFGTKLLNLVICGQLAGSLEQQVASDSFRCTIEVPLDALSDDVLQETS